MNKTAILRTVPCSGPVIVVALVWLSCATNISAGEPKTVDAAGIEFFEKKVRPVLVQHCYTCHSHAGGKMRGGLALDSRSGWEKGGDSGPVIIPGNPGKSLLIQAVRHAQPDLKMPREKLSDAEIAVLTEWVQKGAADPRVLAQENRRRRMVVAQTACQASDTREEFRAPDRRFRPGQAAREAADSCS